MGASPFAPFAPLLIIIGRVLLGALFVIGGVRHFGELDPLTDACRARGVPAPRLSLIVASLFQIVCGLMLMVSLLVAWAAAGLILFTLVASAVMVDFWNQEGERRTGSINVWLSNLALIGGLLIAASTAVAVPETSKSQSDAAVSARVVEQADGKCTLPALALADNAQLESTLMDETKANFAAAFQNACAKGLIKDKPLIDPRASGHGKLFLINAPEANVASIYLSEVDGSRMVLEYPFLTTNGKTQVPSAEELEEAIYCAVRGATSEEQESADRCLVD